MQDQTDRHIHDGERVRARLSELNLSHAEFNGMMEWGDKRIYTMLKKADWETGELAKAGRLLTCNFFDVYIAGSFSRLLDHVRIPIGALSDPKVIETLRGEIIALAEELRKQ